jgi:aminopeptidase
MKMDKKKYADLAAYVGVSIKKDDYVVIASSIETYEFTRLVAASAYEAGAKDVYINWTDGQCTKLRFEKADESVFETVPAWQVKFFEEQDAKRAAYINIISEDPDLLGSIDPVRIKKNIMAQSVALKAHRIHTMSNISRWTVVAAPSKAWASKVFPNETPEDAVDKLWEAIAQTCRMNSEDPVKEWHEHNRRSHERCEILNAKQLKSLKYKNSLGTDFEVKLPKGHIWLGGSEDDAFGTPFNPNIPTEEVFTLPDRLGANGRVVSSLPLSYNGKLIEDFEITFKDGKAVSFKAGKNEDVLKSIIENDPGSSYLGEVALVPSDSPITKLGILFYNTLFDENASCHLALGKAYPTSIQGSEGKSEEELRAMGVNDALVHVDFMVGSDDLSIVGIEQDGSEFPVFVDGKFAF